MPKPGRRSRRPAKTPEERENRLISLALDLAEKQIREGTVSAQVLTHYLKLGTERERLERAKIEADTKVAAAKVKAAAANERLEALYEDALKAMRTYSGQHVEEVVEDEEEL